MAYVFWCLDPCVLCQCVHVSMCPCVNVSMCQCVHVSMCQCVHVSMCQCVNVSMCQCGLENAHIPSCGLFLFIALLHILLSHNILSSTAIFLYINPNIYCLSRYTCGPPQMTIQPLHIAIGRVCQCICPLGESANASGHGAVC
jgi:hypothetical protein